MRATTDPFNSDLAAGTVIGGYRLLGIHRLSEIEAFFYTLEHGPTGARHAHISCEDTENIFGVAFKTVPTDDTGVAHILEHTALCGSRKFPVRDPFFSMLKRSLSTFMNAFTAADWTMYPFATQNRKDYYNLMAVYLDAAFFPNLEELNFKQEGHRLEVEGRPGADEDYQLVYRGVVYNEMKGAMSSPSQVFARSLLTALYPDTTYRYNSGGDPRAIPRLTHAQLTAFHRRHYHPSNAFFYTYGNLPLRDHLSFIEDKVLGAFTSIDPATTVPPQPRWQAPRQASAHYPLDPGEDAGRKSQVCLAWLTADVQDTFEVLVLTLLEQILLGNSSAPLRRALIESGLGSALCDSVGYDAENRDTLFVAGLKDTDSAEADRIEAIIFEVLTGLAEEGIDPELIESAIHQVEFHRKEKTNTPYPFGLKLLMSFTGTWIHGGDPLRILRIDDDLKVLRERLAEGGFFENRIRRYLLDNPHRVRFILSPDVEMTRRTEMQAAEELAARKAELTAAELRHLVADAEALRRLQEAKEDLSLLPTLQLNDIPPEVQRVAPREGLAGPLETCYRQPTAGIFYFTSAIGTGMLDAQLLPLAPFFGHVWSQVGTAAHDYAQTARRIALYTGGLGMAAQSRTLYDAAGTCLPLSVLNGKCLVRNQRRMFELIEELTLQRSFQDLQRLQSVLLEYKAALEAMIVQAGHRLAISLACRSFSASAALSEQWSGVLHFRAIKAIAADLSEERLAKLAADLETIADTLFASDNCRTALVGEHEALQAAAPLCEDWRRRLGEHGGDGFQPPGLSLDATLPREGWSTSTSVSFVAQALPTVRMDHDDAPVLAVISKLLRSLYLHGEIREKGGAYGGFALYNPETGLFCMASYRDPHIVRTLEVYAAAERFLQKGDYGSEDVKEAVLQVCSEIDKPDPPGQAARKAFARKLVGLSDDARQTFKERLLAVTAANVRDVAAKYFGNLQQEAATAVIGNSDKLEAANERLGDGALELRRI